MNAVPHALRQAGKLQQAGQLAPAEALCRRILEADPTNAEVHNLLGVLAKQSGRPDQALAWYGRAAALAPAVATYRSNRGVVYQELGRLAEAEAEYREALRLDPDHGDAHGNLTLLLRDRGRLAEAEVHGRTAVRHRPESVGAHNNLGLVLLDQQHLDEAVEQFREAFRLQPAYLEARSNLAFALIELSRLEEAETHLRAVLQHQPDRVEALNNLANVLVKRDRNEEALPLCRRALELKTDYPEAHYNLGNALMHLGRFDEAEASFRRAVQLRPGFVEAWNNLGSMYYQKPQGRFDEAEACYRRALELRPKCAEAWANLGLVSVEQGKMNEGLACYDRALRLRPDHAEARMNRALAWLVSGDYERGWAEYEWRWRRKGRELPAHRQPLWDGSSLEGRTILLYPEQGLGDTILFVRYAALVKQRGGTVLFSCPPPLLRLFASCPGIDRLVPEGDPLPAFDVHAPLVNLPRLFGTVLTTVPAPVPYLAADPGLAAYWRGRLAALDGFKVGIVWQGNPRFPEDRKRSVPLTRFEGIARLPGVRLISLQKGAGSEQVRVLAGRFPVLDWGPELDRDGGAFMDTAAVMAGLDLVIAVDTAVVHLAGALGVPTWVAQCCVPYWTPWLLGREDSPWYPTVRLFRQPRLGDWDDVFARLAEELRARLASPAGPRPVLVEVAPGELLDRISILRIKCERLADEPKRRNCRVELAVLERARAEALPRTSDLAILEAELKAVNEQLWDIEDAIRVCERDRDFGPRFVELARSVYKGNDRRAALKRRINELLG
jgi:Flp pilus assembly protein TadD